MPVVPQSELIFDFARSGGPGGQNVNKVESKVILRWEVGKSLAFTDEEKARIRIGLANRLSSEDEVVIAVDEERSQLQNRAIATERLNTLVAQALHVPKKRRPTKPSRAAKRKRLETKVKHSQKKQSRKSIVL